MLESRENGVHEPEELKYEPAHGNAEVGSELHGLQEGEDYGAREPDNSTLHPAPSPTANAAAKPVLDRKSVV